MKGAKAWWAHVEERNRKIMAANPDLFERYCAPQLKPDKGRVNQSIVIMIELKDKSEGSRLEVYPPLDEIYRDENGIPLKGTRAWWVSFAARHPKYVEANPEMFERVLGKKSEENGKQADFEERHNR